MAATTPAAGCRRADRSAAARRRWRAAVGAGLLVAAGCGRAIGPAEVFRRSVADPIPPSVVVLDAHADRGLDVRYWTHFRIAPRDLAGVLAAGPFGAPAPADGLDFANLRPPAWWDPAQLGPGRTVVRAEDPAGREAEWTKVLVVDAGAGEVYAVQYYPY